MTKEKMRVKLAEWAGWTLINATGKQPVGMNPYKTGSACSRVDTLPNYPEDLNAVHSLEEKLSPEQHLNFAYQLYLVCKAENPNRALIVARISATAHQRCEALLKTLGLWEKEGKEMQ